MRHSPAFTSPLTLATRARPHKFLSPHRRHARAVMSCPAEASRVRVMNTKRADNAASFVLYWMQNSVRARFNPALERAAFLAAERGLPLRAAYLFTVVAADERPLPERHAAFLVEGLREVREALRKRGVLCAVVAPGVECVDAVRALARGAAVVVTDASYLRPGVRARVEVAEALSVPLEVVEADVVVPVETASDKFEYAARTIRPKITRLMPDFIRPFEHVPLSFQGAEGAESGGWLATASEREEDAQLVELDVDEEMDTLLASLHGLDRGAPRISTFVGGEAVAQSVLRDFLEGRLAEYGTGRNEPAKALQSDLSPYLRAGNISPVDIALQAKAFTAKRKDKKSQESLDSFLEELIVRRELAVNATWYNQEYDNFEKIIPAFAKASLELHKADKRTHVYSYEEFETGVTHDGYWNAAQREMVVTGKMHGYMRMYWSKKIIEWTPDAPTAFDYALRLNNRWELDATDPNSYVGVAWCFGLHDQGWREREVFGKVRFMNDAGLKRKFNMAAYLAKIERLVAKHGLPKHVVEINKRRSRRVGGVQTTIEESIRRKRAPSETESAKRAKRSRSLGDNN